LVIFPDNIIYQIYIIIKYRYFLLFVKKSFFLAFFWYYDSYILYNTQFTIKVAAMFSSEFEASNCIHSKYYKYLYISKDYHSKMASIVFSLIILLILLARSSLPALGQDSCSQSKSDCRASDDDTGGGSKKVHAVDRRAASEAEAAERRSMKKLELDHPPPRSHGTDLSSHGDPPGEVGERSLSLPVKFLQLKRTSRAVVPRNSTQNFCLNITAGSLARLSVMDSILSSSLFTSALDMFSYNQLHIVPLNSYQSFDWYSISLNSSDNSLNLFSYLFPSSPMAVAVDKFIYSCPSPLYSDDRQMCNIFLSPLAHDACVSVTASTDSDISVIVLANKYTRGKTVGGLIFAFLGGFYSSLMMEMRVLQYVFGAVLYIFAGPPMIIAMLLHTFFPGANKFIKKYSLFFFLSSWGVYSGCLVWLAMTALENTILRGDDLSMLPITNVLFYAVVMGNIGLLSVFWMRNKEDATKEFIDYFHVTCRRFIVIASYLAVFNSFASLTMAVTATAILLSLRVIYT
jgi:hypothetical protein